MQKLKNFIYLKRKYIAVLHDGLMAAASFLIALYLRLDQEFNIDADFVTLGVPIFTAICLVVFSLMRLYRGLWRFASLQDLYNIFKAVSLSILIFLLCMFMITRLEGIPRSVLFINWLLLLMMLGAPRFIYRLAKDKSLGFDFFSLSDSRIPVLLIGSGMKAELFLRETASRSNSNYRAVGILDANPANRNTTLRGIRIYGDYTVFGKVIDKLERKGAKPLKAILCDEDIDGEVLKSILSAAETKGVTLARLPSLTEFSGRLYKALEVRPINFEDLLGRAQNTLDYQAMQKLIEGKAVLVTGAGGTIGSELCRQIANFSPQRLIMLDSSEFNLYEINREIGSQNPLLSRKAVLADVRSRSRMGEVFTEHKPQLVFHAAAIKHVPIAEENLEEAILTNIIGTRNVAELALKTKSEAMVLISTDKAVYPSSVMGATKRLAELNCLELGRKSKDTNFIAVRFGNVLGSRGSVLPLFQEQLAKGGPLTVTHPEMTRYFMTTREAVGLVILATSLGVNDAECKGGIFILDMGKPVNIREMAEQMIKLAGLKPGLDIAITYTGLRAGEKLHEALYYEFENPKPTRYKGVAFAHMGADKSAKPSKARQLLDEFLSETSTKNELSAITEQVINLLIKQPLQS